VTIWIVGAASAVLAILVGTLLPLLFGPDFSDAVTMTRILLASTVASAGTAVLAAGLTAAGFPGSAARGELLSLVITVPGLMLLLAPLGGDGAALVSLAAYAATFAYLVRRAVRRLGGTRRDFLLLRRDDLALLLRIPFVARAFGSISGFRRRRS
jgi:O-antigen/teichoic acid export membrane protein